MNINLLPNKFIRNRAFEVILFCSIIALVCTIALGLGGFFIYQIQAKKYLNDINTSTVENRLLEQEVAKMSASKSEELQTFLFNQKKEIFLVNPIMTTLEQKAAAVGTTILSYTVVIPDGQGDTAVGDGRGQDGSALFPSISLVVKGSIYENIIKLKLSLESIEWVYDVQYKGIYNEEPPAQAEITLRLIKEKAPKSTIKEASHD